MGSRDWRRRIERAEELAGKDASAAEILRFYATVARFQAEFYDKCKGLMKGTDNAGDPFVGALDRSIIEDFRRFLLVVDGNGPEKLQEAAREVRGAGDESHFELLTTFWTGGGLGAPSAETADFFARAFLQPYAVWVRERQNLRWTGPTAFVCPFCKRKPGLGVLRPLGDGGQRSLVCSFCLAEWEFRRILCPGCGEEDPAKLPVYVAEDLPHVRLDGCDSCKTYIKTVDLTKSGLGEPMVDEIASIPLDLWAEQRGYRKLQVNLMQF